MYITYMKFDILYNIDLECTYCKMLTLVYIYVY